MLKGRRGDDDRLVVSMQAKAFQGAGEKMKDIICSIAYIYSQTVSTLFQNRT